MNLEAIISYILLLDELEGIGYILLFGESMSINLMILLLDGLGGIDIERHPLSLVV
jgi:hypothetical protein